jgi:hypothetical protein
VNGLSFCSLVGRYEAGFLFGLRGSPRSVLLQIFRLILIAALGIRWCKMGLVYPLAHRFNCQLLKRVKLLENAVS